MLPGMHPGHMEDSVLSSLTVVNTAAVQFAASPNNITIPTVQDGDLLFYFSPIFRTSDPTFSLPSGWVTVDDWRPPGSSWDLRYHTMLRIASAADSGTTINTGSGFTSCARLLVVVRGNRPIKTATPGSQDADYEIFDNPAAQTVNVSGAVAPTIVFGTYASGGAVSPRTFTIGGVAAKDGELTVPGVGANTAWVAWKSFDIGGVALSNVVIDMDDEGNSNSLSSCYIACT